MNCGTSKGWRMAMGKGSSTKKEGESKENGVGNLIKQTPGTILVSDGIEIIKKGVRTKVCLMQTVGFRFLKGGSNPRAYNPLASIFLAKPIQRCGSCNRFTVRGDNITIKKTEFPALHLRRNEQYKVGKYDKKKGEIFQDIGRGGRMGGRSENPPKLTPVGGGENVDFLKIKRGANLLRKTGSKKRGQRKMRLGVFSENYSKGPLLGKNKTQVPQR